MSEESRPSKKEEMRAEYNIRGGVRGKYYERYREETNVVLLEPTWRLFSATRNQWTEPFVCLLIWHGNKWMTPLPGASL
jgi:hypothetical protein